MHISGSARRNNVQIVNGVPSVRWGSRRKISMRTKCRGRTSTGQAIGNSCDGLMRMPCSMSNQSTGWAATIQRLSRSGGSLRKRRKRISSFSISAARYPSRKRPAGDLPQRYRLAGPELCCRERARQHPPAAGRRHSRSQSPRRTLRPSQTRTARKLRRRMCTLASERNYLAASCQSLPAARFNLL